jgi:hypothetical protein
MVDTVDNANNEAYKPYEQDAEDTVRHENLKLAT